jgi:hypothetical protein
VTVAFDIRESLLLQMTVAENRFGPFELYNDAPYPEHRAVKVEVETFVRGYVSGLDHQALDAALDTYKQFKSYGDELALERCIERQLRAVLEVLYPSGTGDAMSSRSRQQTKDALPRCSRAAALRAMHRLQVGGREREHRVRRLDSPAALKRSAVRPSAGRRCREDARVAFGGSGLTPQGSGG